MQKFFDYANRLLQQLVSDYLGSEHAGCRGPGLVWLNFAVVRPVGCIAKLSKTPYGSKMNIQLMGNSSGGDSCSHHANRTLPQNLQHLWHCAV